MSTSSPRIMQLFDEQDWSPLYRVGAIVALVGLAIIALAIPAFLVYPYAPGRLTTEQIFALIETNPLGALLALDLLLLLGNLTSAVLMTVLFVSLRPVNPSYALLAFVLGIYSSALLFSARPILELFQLSSQFAASTNESDRMQLLAAGSAHIASFDGVAWFFNTLVGALSLSINSLLMLRSSIFSRATAWVGIATNISVCFFFLPVVGTALLFVSVIGYIVWYPLLALDFYRMGWRKT